ncbi:MAG: hypothetical protein AB7N71_08520, partial [Phycisphaerae bacterium]
MAASSLRTGISPPCTVFRPTWRLLVLVLWCVWEALQRGLAAKVFYQLATANHSKTLLQVLYTNLPTMLLFCGCAVGLIGQFNWSRPLVIVLATWSIVTQLLPDEWFARPYGGESAWRISVTSAVILVPVVVFAWTFRFSGEAGVCPANMPEQDGGTICRASPLLRGVWTKSESNHGTSESSEIRVRLNDQTSTWTSAGPGRAQSRHVRTQWIRPR